MKRRSLLLGCSLAGLLILVLLAAGGAWWFYFGQFTTAAASTSTMQVSLLSPTSGDEVEAGGFVQVNLRALAPGAISWSEVFVDGNSLGAITVSPEHASWTWQAWPAGIHVLSGRAQAADGQLTDSQTVIVNVQALTDVFQASAGEGQSVADVGAKFGVPPDQIAGANPKLDPSKPLSEGQPVNVPTGGGGGSGKPQPPGGGGSGAVNKYLTIVWKFTASEPVDKSYCYTSTGNGNWEKMPKQPFEFFPGAHNVYTQVLEALPAGKTVFQMDCWGWLGGALKYLGQAQADKEWDGGVVNLSGKGFVLTGAPLGNGPLPEVIGTQIPAPYAVRQTKDITECFAHKGNLELCKLIVNQMKNDILVVWEWQPAVNLPGQTTWLNQINGYRLYQLGPGNAKQLLQEVTSPAIKVAAAELPWGTACYGVEAYHESYALGGLSSPMTTFCLGESPATEKLTLTPSQWMTTSGVWAKLGCENAGGLDPYVDANTTTGFGNQAGQVLVGSLVVDDEDVDCFLQESHTAAVKFDIPALPPGAVVQKAVLRFSAAFKEYAATGVAANFKLSCAGGWGIAAEDWSGLINPIHYSEPDALKSAAYNKPLDSLSGWDDTPEVDVSWQVVDWLKQPSTSHGFILTARKPPYPASDGSGTCYTGYDGFKLEINYFTP